MRTHPRERRRRISIAAISLICSLFAVGTANAQSAEAEVTFTEGDKLMSEGKLAQACDAFEASNRLESRAGTLIRLGQCREQNHQLASAWLAYKDSLTRAKDPKKVAVAKAKVAELEPKVSSLTITVAPENKLETVAVTRNGRPVDPAVWSRAIPTDGGDYVIVGSAPGYAEWKTKVTVPNEGGKIQVTVPKLESPAKPAVMPAKPNTPLTPTDGAPQATARETAAPQTTEEDTVASPTSSRFTTKRKIAVGLGVVGAAAVASGFVLGSQSRNKQDDAHMLCADPPMPCANADQANALIDAARSRALGADIAFGVGAAALIGAGVLWFTGAPSAAETNVAVTSNIKTGELGLVVSGRF